MNEAWKQKPTPDWIIAKWEDVFERIDSLILDRRAGTYLHGQVEVNQMKRVRNMLDLEIDAAERKEKSA